MADEVVLVVRSEGGQAGAGSGSGGGTTPTAGQSTKTENNTTVSRGGGGGGGGGSAGQSRSSSLSDLYSIASSNFGSFVPGPVAGLVPYAQRFGSALHDIFNPAEAAADGTGGGGNGAGAGKSRKGTSASIPTVKEMSPEEQLAGFLKGTPTYDALPAGEAAGAGEGAGAAGLAGGALAATAAVAALAGAAIYAGYALDRMASGMAEKYGQYSPVIATQQALNEMQGIMNDIHRATEIAPELAEYLKARFKLEQSVEDIKLALMKYFLPLMTSLVDMIGSWLGRSDQDIGDPEGNVEQIIQAMANQIGVGGRPLGPTGAPTNHGEAQEAAMRIRAGRPALPGN